MVKRFTQALIQRYRRFYLVVVDVFLFTVAGVLALALRYDFSIPALQLENLWVVSAISAVVLVVLFFLLGLYDSLWQFAGVDELISTAVASILGAVVLWGIGYLYPFYYPRSWYLLFPLLVMVLCGGIRVAYRILRRTRSLLPRLAGTQAGVMVVGGGESGAMVIRELNQNPQLEKRPVVIVDDDEKKQGLRIYGVPIAGTRWDIPRLATRYSVREIIIAIPAAPPAETRAIVEICKETKCRLRILPALHHLIEGKVSLKKLRDVDLEDLLGREPVSLDLGGIEGYLKGQTVLVTGGGGSIGAELCRQVARFSPARLVLFDMAENGAYAVWHELRDAHPRLPIHLEIGSVQDPRRLEALFSGYSPQVVFHAAAYKHVPLMEENPREAVRNNVFGTWRLAQAADRSGTGRFVMISTDKAVHPTSVMGATKRIAEMVVQCWDRSSATDYSAVRFGNVLGSDGSVIPLFRRQIARGGPVTVTDPQMTRYFMTIPEAVQLVLEAGALARGGEVFVLDMGEPVRILRLAEDLIKLSGYIPYEEIDISFVGMRPGEKLFEELLLDEERVLRTDNEKIFVERPLACDLPDMHRWLRKLRAAESRGAAEIQRVIREMIPDHCGPRPDTEEGG